jgi:hypothetical protein
VRKALAVALVALTGCGGASGGGGSPKASIVDPNGNPPLVSSLEVEPGTGKLLVTTNRGFFRVDPKAHQRRRDREGAQRARRRLPRGPADRAQDAARLGPPRREPHAARVGADDVPLAGRRRQVAPARAFPRRALCLAGAWRALPRGRRREHLGLGRRRGQLEPGRPRARASRRG